MNSFYRVFFWLGMATATLGACLLVKQAVFLQTARRTEGVVVRVDATNVSHSWWARGSASYTQFSARVEFPVESKTYNFPVLAGRGEGHDAPTTEARHRVGDRVRVIYSPSNPSHAHADTYRDVWKIPLAFVFASFVFFLVHHLFSGWTQPIRLKTSTRHKRG